ncbi:SIMPL domain-containing protein [Salsuginibacillus kocurii]|uniref:SIMPL domain-containing protein n=1 Tax=Salsuginibacillus kocurii TaxID=427078 RepID=UPI000369951D|nr:SIMPL domain-containing protein [Salsuginibacillus kocurii]
MKSKSTIYVGTGAAALVGLGMLFTVLVPGPSDSSNTLDAEEGDHGTVVVSGEGEVSIDPDLAYVRLGAEAVHGSADEAQNDVTESVESVRSALSDVGVGDEQIETVQYHVQPQRQPDEGEEEYRAHHIIEIEYEDIDGVGELIDIATEAGANQIQQTRFTLDDPTEAEQEAAQLAIENTEPRAEALAEGAGKARGEIVQIIDQEAQVEVPTEDMAQEEVAEDAIDADQGEGTTEIEAGQIEVVQRVDAVYRLE